MKSDRRRILKYSMISVLITLVVCSGIFYYVFAATPTTQMHLTGGPYPGAPSYTVWREGSNYFAKDKNGQIDYSGTNASQVMQNAIDNGYYIFIKKGNYSLTHILKVDHARRISGELRQWSGNAANPTPDQVGVNLYFSGANPNDPNIGVLNITAIGDVIIEHLAIQGTTRTKPYVNMSAIQISGPSASHGVLIDHLEISFFQVGIGGMGGKQGPVDSVFRQVKIQNCSVGLQVVSTGNYFERMFFWGNEYDVAFIGTVYGTHGTTFFKCFFNDAIYYPIWFCSQGNETETSFTDCWFEGLGQGLIVITPDALTVKNLIFSVCHLHTSKITGYFADFSKITNGLVQILSCTFDGSGGTVTAINPSSHIVIEKCWLKTAGGLEQYKGTVNSGSVEASDQDWIAHGLIGTPTCILATVGEYNKIYIVQVRASNSTHFQIDLFYESAGTFVIEGTDRTVYWYAEYKP